MGNIGPELVTEYIDSRLADEVTAFTIKKELGHLRQVLVIARYNKVFHLAPEEVFPPYFSGGHKPRERFLTPRELDLLVAQLDNWRAAHVLFIVATGARWGESLRARRGDVDWEARAVHLRGTKTNSADDDVAITKLAHELLERSLAMSPGRDVLFHSWDNAIRDIKAACVRAGIPKASPNDLRRTHGKWLRLAGASPALISKQLRHTTDKLAQTTYAKVSGRETAALIDAQLTGVSNLYPEGASDDSEEHPMRDETPEKPSAPGHTRNADLRFRKPTSERRSVGTKAGLRRAAENRVPVLYADPSAGERVFRALSWWHFAKQMHRADRQVAS